MIVLTNKQINQLFETDKPLLDKPLYFPKGAGYSDTKGHIIDGVRNRAALHPFDKLVFYACLTHIQHGGGVCSITTLCRHITGKKPSEKQGETISDSLKRLKAVTIEPQKIHKGGKKEKLKARGLLDFDEIKNGYIINKSNYIDWLTSITKTARTIPPNYITAYKGKSEKMLLIEYDFITRLFYLHKSKNKKQSIKQDIKRYCEKYNISITHKYRYIKFLTAVCINLQAVGFIKSFTVSGDEITATS